MAIADWKELGLLADPAVRDPALGASHRQRTRRLLDQLAALTLFNSTTTFWRGQAKPWRIEPKMSRRGGAVSKATVDDLLDQAKRATLYWQQGLVVRESTELDRLALLQHTDTSTPLLDVTADPLVALWFAVEKDDESDGIVVGFNADKRWVDLSFDKRSYWAIQRELELDSKVGWTIPPRISDRIVVQRARMVVAPLSPPGHWLDRVTNLAFPDLTSGWKAEDQVRLFDEAGAGRRRMPPLVAFRIPRDLKGWLRSTLQSNYGISNSSLFPEPEGFRPT